MGAKRVQLDVIAVLTNSGFIYVQGTYTVTTANIWDLHNVLI